MNYSEYPSTSHTSVNYSASDERIILVTDVVRVRSSSGQMIQARALLDSGSQTNLVTEELAQLLSLKKERGRLNLNTIAETNSLSKSRVTLTVTSSVSSTQFASKFWVLKSITNLQPDRRVNIANFSIPSNVKLADPCFYEPQKLIC